MSQMKICPNGHRYDASLPACPYCPSSDSHNKTLVDETAVGAGVTLVDESSAPNNYNAKTLTADDMNKDDLNRAPKHSPRATMILTNEEHSDASKDVSSNKKLVGWVACFTWNSYGDSYVLRQGKTLIGSSPDSEIHIEDPLISASHAQFLYRGNKLRIRDNFSSNGTFVNDEDIEDEPRILLDGDEIRMGSTVFKLKLV